MNNTITPEWCLKMADQEAEFAASLSHAYTELPIVEIQESVDSEAAHNIAFARLVRLMRRRAHLSVEQLANATRVDLVELVEIEKDARHRADPRTVYQLAQYFDLPAAKLLQMAHLSVPKDARLAEEAIRFAARSESIDELSAVEQAALEAFVAVLSEQSEKP